MEPAGAVRSPVAIENLRPQLVIEAHDKNLGRLGWLVIDRASGPTAVGGVRLAPDVTCDEVASLARAMTLKSGFLGLGTGGAKAGVAVDAGLLGTRRREVFEAFGRALAPLIQNRAYLPGEDLGTTPEDVAAICGAAGLYVTPSSFDGSRFAALTVFESLRRACQSRGLALAGLRVAIEGLGRVGSEVARMVAAEKGRVVAVSTREGALANAAGFDVGSLLLAQRRLGDAFVLEARETLGGQPLALADLLVLDVDVLVPCARPWTISSANVRDVKARLVVPGANIPVTPEAEEALFAAGQVYLPDFLTNCGTVLAAQMHAAGFGGADIEAVIRQDFAAKVGRVLDEAQATGRAVADVARRVAWEGFESARVAVRPAGFTFVRLASALHRRGILRPAVHRAALERFRRRLAAPGSC